MYMTLLISLCMILPFLILYLIINTRNAIILYNIIRSLYPLLVNVVAEDIIIFSNLLYWLTIHYALIYKRFENILMFWHRPN